MVQEKTTKEQIEIAKAFNLNIADDLADVGFIKIMNILKSIFDYPIDERPAEFAGALQPVDRRKAGHATEINLPV